MNYRLLGNSGLRVSELALGTMTFGEEWGWGVACDAMGCPAVWQAGERRRIRGGLAPLWSSRSPDASRHV